MGGLGGIVGQALGGTGAYGGGSDTIELHIHAFMPSGRGENGPNQSNSETSNSAPNENSQNTSSANPSSQPTPNAEIVINTQNPAPTIPPQAVQMVQERSEPRQESAFDLEPSTAPLVLPTIPNPPLPTIPEPANIAPTITNLQRSLSNDNNNIQVSATNVQTEINSVHISRGNTVHEVNTPISLGNGMGQGFTNAHNLMSMGFGNSMSMSNDVTPVNRPPNQFVEVGIQVDQRQSRRGRRDRNRDRPDLSFDSVNDPGHPNQLRDQQMTLNREIDTSKVDAACQYEVTMVDQETQGRVNTYPKWTQTAEEMTTMRAQFTQNENLATEERVDTHPLSKTKPRDISNKIHKKRSVISKAAIKPSVHGMNPPSDLVFSPTDRRGDHKFASTMKKANTMTNNPSRLGSTNTNSGSNRFLFRGNEEFHGTVGRYQTDLRQNNQDGNQPLFMTSGNKQKSKQKHQK